MSPRARKAASPEPRGPGRPRLEPGRKEGTSALTIRLGPALMARLERIRVRRKLRSLAEAARSAIEQAQP